MHKGATYIAICIYGTSDIPSADRLDPFEARRTDLESADKE